MAGTSHLASCDRHVDGVPCHDNPVLDDLALDDVLFAEAGPLVPLGQYLCRVIGESLDHLARTAHSWPAREEFPAPEAWTGALQREAAPLRRYRPALRDTHAPAQDALHWVADHLMDLWN